MKIILLGNGFDLNHMLPTKYENFLHTVDFLVNNYDDSFETVADVFGNDVLQKQDKMITASFKQYGEGYKKVYLDKEKVTKLVGLAKNNYWYSYFLKSYNKDLGWIDFEKEIATVIEKLELFLKVRSYKFSIYNMNNKMDLIFGNIVNHFDYYYNRTPEDYNQGIITPEYRVEVPFGTGNFIMNKPKVIDQLYGCLREFAKMLSIYLELFVDNSTRILLNQKLFKVNDLFFQDSQVITFNYTNTFENAYQSSHKVIHIHGNILNEIVLGVNSDLRDELEKIDTTFIKFKKYYQRVFYRTDMDYLSSLTTLKSNNNFNNGNDLYVVGHSLDVTDKEVIKEIFSHSRRITIYYHDESAVGQYISNLVTIYGKEEFDLLRTKHHLTFEKL